MDVEEKHVPIGVIPIFGYAWLLPENISHFLGYISA